MTQSRFHTTRRSWLFAAAAGLTPACSSHRARRVIGVVPKGTSHVFWQTLHLGVLAAERECGVNVLWNGPQADTDYARQIQIVDAMIAQRVAGLAVSATDYSALNAALERAARIAIPVVIFDSGVTWDKFVSFVATDNAKGGELGAMQLARLIGGKGRVAMIMHAPGTVATSEREVRFEQVLAERFPRIKLVAKQYGQGERSRALAAAENILAAHPDLDGVFTSGEPGTLGAVLALKGRRLEGRVKMVGFDATEQLVAEVKAGAIQALVVQDPFRIGFEAVNTLVDKLDGGTPPPRIDLPAQVVTVENVDQPEIRAVLFPSPNRRLR